MDSMLSKRPCHTPGHFCRCALLLALGQCLGLALLLALGQCLGLALLLALGQCLGLVLGLALRSVSLFAVSS